MVTEVHQGTSQPSSYLPTGYLFGQDHSARLPDGQALGWTSEGSSEDQDQSADMDSGYLGISTDLIPYNNPSRYPPLLVSCNPRHLAYKGTVRRPIENNLIIHRRLAHTIHKTQDVGYYASERPDPV